MSVERLFHWTCDSCSLEVVRHPYGLPPGWMVVPANLREKHETLHFCTKECHQKRFPKDSPDKDDKL